MPNDELHVLCFSPSIIRLIMPRRVILEGYVAHVRVERNACGVMVGQ